MTDIVAAYGHLDGIDLIRALTTEALPGRVAVLSSFGAEAAVLLDLVAQVDPGLPVIFIDTGHLFDETLDYADTLIRHLGLTDVRRPNPFRWAGLPEEQWRVDPDECCRVNKVEPLARAVHGFAGLIDGRKRCHGDGRKAMGTVERAGDGMIKISPLAHWAPADIERAFRERGLPRHPLVAAGYHSIGCWPCTAPTQDPTAPRSGRWAGAAKTECGIHLR